MRGATASFAMFLNFTWNFNPRSPCGERLTLVHKSSITSRISIHAPHAGSDVGTNRSWEVRVISIHAPHAGSDCKVPSLCFVALIFQSTLPMRGATSYPWYPVPSDQFQSTLPMRGATLYNIDKERSREFQSTLPMRGATLAGQFVVPTKLFQSTLPMRGATFMIQLKKRSLEISIHAPHAGSDLPVESSFTASMEFQSTLPMRGATDVYFADTFRTSISIHAPHAGSDVYIFGR